jgi:hypothetical protein
VFLASALTLALLSLSPAALAASSSKGGLSKGSGSKSSSKSGFSSSKSKSSNTKKSKSSKTKSSARSPKAGSSKGTTQAVTIPGSGAAPASAPVREDGTAADEARIRGAYFSEATFAALPCARVEVSVGERRYWRCGDAWFETLIYDGRPVYVEVFAPEGAQVDRLPERAQSIRGENTIYFATDDAVYEPSQQTRGGYVVVATSPGFRVEELPDAARRGVPIVAAGATYYRYLGVYYREVREDGRTYYVVSESPF